MNKQLKKVLRYALLPVLIVALSIILGIAFPERTKLNMGEFDNAEVSEQGYIALAWDDEKELLYMESQSFPEGTEGLILVTQALAEANGYLVQLNDDWEEISETAFDVKPGTVEQQFEFVPGTTSFRLMISDENTLFMSAIVTKTTGLNMRIALYGALFLFALYGLFVFFPFISKRPEVGFLIAAICIMAVLFIFLPMEGMNVWDEAIHVEKTERIARIGIETSLSDGVVHTVFSDIGYIPGAVGMRIGLLFTDDASILFMIARIANALTYIAVCFFAVKYAIRYKMIFAVTALMPTAMLLANSCSYDFIVNGFMFLYFSLLMTEMLTPEKKLTSGRAIVIALSLFAACAPKAVYIPIAGLLLFLPKSKFASKKQHTAFNFAVIAVFLAVLATFLIPFLAGAPGYNDTRGGEGVNSSAQLAFILSNPLTYARYLFTFIYENFGRWLQGMFSSFAYCGSVTPSMAMCIALLPIYTGLTDVPAVSKDVPTLAFWRKSILFACVLAVIIFICTSLFIAFTEVGATSIAGVQSRYFIALIPAMLVLLQPAFAVKKKPGMFYQSGVLAATVIVNFAMVFRLLVV